MSSLARFRLTRHNSVRACANEYATIGSMRVYSRDELERLRAIKRLVDDGGINLAGVQRLLSIAEVVQRMRPLMRDEPLSTREARRLTQEVDQLARLLGFD